MSDISVMKICPVCYKYTTCKFDLEKYYQFLKDKCSIDNVIEDGSEYKKRFLKTGMCFNCQKKMYSEYTSKSKRVSLCSKC